MSSPYKQRTVKVLLHFTASGEVGVAVVRSWWQGAQRLDRRVANLQRVDPVIPPPRGVDEDLWAAHCALSDLVWRVQESNRRLAR